MRKYVLVWWAYSVMTVFGYGVPVTFFLSSSKLEKVVFDKPSLYICMYCKWLVLYYLFMSFCFGLTLFPSVRLPDCTRVPCDFFTSVGYKCFFKSFFSIHGSVFVIEWFSRFEPLYSWLVVVQFKLFTYYCLRIFTLVSFHFSCLIVKHILFLGFNWLNANLGIT